MCVRLGRNDRGLSSVEYDDHTLPGEAVLLNGHSTQACSSTNPYNKPAPPPPPPATTTKDVDPTTYGRRLNWDDTRQLGDCPTCRDTHAACHADDSEVCFTEELVRRKLLLGRGCPSSILAAESQYDTVPMSGASTEVMMRTFKGLQQPATSCWPSQTATPCNYSRAADCDRVQ